MRTTMTLDDELLFQAQRLALLGSSEPQLGDTPRRQTEAA